MPEKETSGLPALDESSVLEARFNEPYRAQVRPWLLTENTPKASIRAVKTDPEYRKLLPALSKHQFGALKESVREHGLHVPIDVSLDGTVLDGHHRLKICELLGIKPEYRVIKSQDPLEERRFVIETNLQRRQLNDFQKVEQSQPLEEIEVELAKKRMVAGKALGSNEPRGKTVDIIASRIGVTQTTYFRARTIIAKGPEELKKKLRNGNLSINSAYSMIRREQLQKLGAPPLPSGKFDIVYADPPWRTAQSLSPRGSPEHHYPTMTLDQIAALQIPSSNNSVLFLWAIPSMIREAMLVMDRWGFQYRSQLVWTKDRFGTGHYFRIQHELLLLGMKGKMPTPLEHDRPRSVLSAPMRAHSQKPDEIYSIIEKMYPGRKYLELFARRSRQGWIAWGNQLDSLRPPPRCSG